MGRNEASLRRTCHTPRPSDSRCAGRYPRHGHLLSDQQAVQGGQAVGGRCLQGEMPVEVKTARGTLRGGGGEKLRGGRWTVRSYTHYRLLSVEELDSEERSVAPILGARALLKDAGTQMLQLLGDTEEPAAGMVGPETLVLYNGFERDQMCLNGLPVPCPLSFSATSCSSSGKEILPFKK